MSATLTRELISRTLRIAVSADLPDMVEAEHALLRDRGEYPTLPPMPVDRKRVESVAAARASAPRLTATDVLYVLPSCLPGAQIRDGRLYVGDQLVATATRDDDAVIVHVTPPGCDTSVTNVSAHRDPVGRVLEAIHAS